MERKNNKQTFITLCVILVIGIGYIYQMAPSPVLGQLKDRYGIGNEALLNLAVSIVHPLTIGASLYGGVLLRRMGLYRMFIWTQVLLAAGILMNLAAGDYLVFLAGRVVYSAGFAQRYVPIYRDPHQLLLPHPLKQAAGFPVPCLRHMGGSPGPSPAVLADSGAQAGPSCGPGR